MHASWRLAELLQHKNVCVCPGDPVKPGCCACRWRDAALLTVLDAVRSITELPPPVGEDTIACLNNVLAALGQLPEWGAGLVEAAGAPALLAAVLLVSWGGEEGAASAATRTSTAPFL